jgi:hypothetical protein
VQIRNLGLDRLMGCRSGRFFVVEEEAHGHN